MVRRVEDRVEDMAEVLVVELAEGGDEAASEWLLEAVAKASRGLARMEGGEASAAGHGDRDEGQLSSVAGMAAPRADGTSAHGVGIAALDVVPPWAMVLRDGPIPDVAPPCLTTRIRGDAANETTEIDVAGDEETPTRR